jgi:hypothetical protein
MGVVYKARQTSLRRLVALKMILAGGYASQEQRARFRTEAEAAARLQHANVVQIYEVGEHQGLPYFSLEFVDGGNLASQLDGSPWLPRQAAQLVQTLAVAVHAAHKQAIVHRDLKPANVLLTADGVPKITDFGLAKVLDASCGLTDTGVLMGTPSYMAPEQADRHARPIGPATDVYALGAVLYELLTGRPPFKGQTPLATVAQVVADRPVPPRNLQPGVPRDLEIICLKCLEKEPSDRYPSAEALAVDLRRFLDDQPILGRAPGPLARFWLWCRRPARIREAGAFTLYMGLGGLIFCLFGIVSLLMGFFGSTADPVASLVALITYSLVIYVPQIWIGLGAMAGRRSCVWLAAVMSTIDLILSVANVLGSNAIADLMSRDCLFPTDYARKNSFLIGAILSMIQLCSCCAGLLASYSRTSAPFAGPASRLGPHRE